jgi:hypothetical protein
MLLLKHFLVGGDVCNIVLSRLPASYQGVRASAKETANETPKTSQDLTHVQ